MAMKSGRQDSHDDLLVEELSEAAHAAWMESKRAQGVTSRRSEIDEELMVPYEALSEAAKSLDRGTVKGTLDAANRIGFTLVPEDVLWHLEAALQLLDDDTRPEVCRWREGANQALDKAGPEAEG